MNRIGSKTDLGINENSSDSVGLSSNLKVSLTKLIRTISKSELRLIQTEMSIRIIPTSDAFELIRKKNSVWINPTLDWKLGSDSFGLKSWIEPE